MIIKPYLSRTPQPPCGLTLKDDHPKLINEVRGMNRPLALTLTARVGLRSSELLNVLMVVAGSLFVAGLAQIRIPLPFTPVPITGQTLGVFLVGATMGSSRAALSLGLYLLEGSLGLPFFCRWSQRLASCVWPNWWIPLGFYPRRLRSRSLRRKRLGSFNPTGSRHVCTWGSYHPRAGSVGVIPLHRPRKGLAWRHPSFPPRGCLQGTYCRFALTHRSQDS